MRALRTISALILAILVLASSTSFMVGMHFCMGEVRSIALFSKADDCTPVKLACPKHKKPDCCKDETVVYQGQTFEGSLDQYDFQPSVTLISFSPLAFIAEVIPSSFPNNAHFTPYDPPLPPRDRVVDLQVFLI